MNKSKPTKKELKKQKPRDLSIKNNIIIGIIFGLLLIAFGIRILYSKYSNVNNQILPEGIPNLNCTIFGCPSGYTCYSEKIGEPCEIPTKENTLCPEGYTLNFNQCEKDINLFDDSICYNYYITLMSGEEAHFNIFSKTKYATKKEAEEGIIEFKTNNNLSELFCHIKQRDNPDVIIWYYGDCFYRPKIYQIIGEQIPECYGFEFYNQTKLRNACPGCTNETIEKYSSGVFTIANDWD